jgi:antitoxin MazE
LLDGIFQCYYSGNVTELKLTRIGNSKGIRLPASLLKRYCIEDVVLVEENEDSITLRPKRSRKLSWKETASEMAPASEDWSDFDAAGADGLGKL